VGLAAVGGQRTGDYAVAAVMRMTENCSSMQQKYYPLDDLKLT